MIAGIPSYHDYLRDRGGPLGRCLTCGFSGEMSNGASGYLCPACHCMAIELKLRDGRVYQQFKPLEDAAKPVARRAELTTQSERDAVAA
jgi:hypothetical protein